MEDVYKVVLHGKHGVGKTWIAKEVMKHAVFKNIVDVTILINLNREHPDYHNTNALYKNIVIQLSTQQDLASTEYHLHGDNMEKNILDILKQKLKGRRYLLVLSLDDPKISERLVMFMLKEMLKFGERNISKILVTKLAVDDMMTINNDLIGDNSYGRRSVAVEINSLTLWESKDLFQRSWNNNHIVSNNDLEEIVKRCNYLPAAVVFTRNVLSYALENAADDLIKKLAIIEAKKQVDDYWMLGCWSGFNKFTNNISLRRCFWLSWVYLKKAASINYNLLIMYWILEGYLDDSTTTLEKAYIEGHVILTDLLDAGLLGEREVGDVVLERAGFNFANYIFPDLCEEPRFRYPCIFEKLDGGGNVKRMNGGIATISKKDWGDKDSIIMKTLILQGNEIFKEDKRKENDTIFKSIITGYDYKPHIVSLSHMELEDLMWMDHLLKVLILKDCCLKNLHSIGSLWALTHLEISGTSLNEHIPKDLFAKFNSLQILNMSGTPIKSFPRPSSRTELRKLEYLFMRKCTQLETFPDVNGLEKLKVLDLYGSKFKSLDKNIGYFEDVPKLEMLDLSETNIEELSGLMKLQNLTHLLVKNCLQLKKIGSLTTLTKLEVIDASGCNALDDVGEVNYLPTGDSLRKLDLSSTMIRTIPPLRNTSKLIYLCLKGCQLTELPPIEGAKNLRVLDVSDVVQLEKINASFQDMESLQEIFLSNTKIKILPPLSGLESLRKLILKGCELLQSLPEMDRLINLLLIDLRGCNALETLLDNGKFDDVTILRS
ncbi:putative disease resistance protein At4g19050 isoform X2 [Beta vulgaris subsp. vulgaris]|nr:putative disease resistance protein At4g19050 isoform X2 [Beta vulgaris subsp. vulgaris]